jgi:hypothetical protein
LSSLISDQKHAEAEGGSQPFLRVSCGLASLLKRYFCSAVLNCPLRGIGAWLMEIHRKIWNRKDRQQKLFRTITIEFTDYERLEKRLAGLRSGRREAAYSANTAEILPVKLAFLQSIPSVASDPLNEEKVGDSYDLYDELRTLFPLTLEYLDLSNLGLQVSSPRMPVPLLIRQEYRALSKLLGELPMDCGDSAIITGQPGTGANMFVTLLLLGLI